MDLIAAPTCAQLEQRCRRYLDLKDNLLQAMIEFTKKQEPDQKELDALKAELIELVKSFGSTHCEKSKILHGVTLEAMATFGTSYSIDGAAVERFRLALVKGKQARLLKRIFRKDERWSLLPESSEIIRGEKKLPKPLLALYAQCSVLKPNTPKLEVRPKK
jgi:hypothetical protein